jgi:uncharacterized protein YfaS (alpha-2-macroglobulin family)
MTQNSTIKTSLLSLAFLALALTLSQCGRKKQPSTAFNPEFSQHIQGHTSGVISAKSTIEIQFVQAPQSAKKGQKAEADKLLQFQPKIKGTAVWKDEYTLQFIPEDALPQGESFSAILKLHKLFDVPKEIEEYVFEFGVIPMLMVKGAQRSSSYPGDVKGYSQISGNFKSSDFLDELMLENIFSVSLNGKKIKPHWTSDGHVHQYQIDSIVRDKNDQHLSFSLNGKTAGFDQKENFDILIPSIENFQVTNVQWSSEGDGKITINFSDPINEKSMQAGLITLDNRDDFRWQVDGSVIYLFPKSKPIGEKTLVIHPQIKSIFGYPLKESTERKIVFESQKPAVQFISDGNILPSTNGLRVPFRYVNLRAIDVVVIKINEHNIHQFLQVNQINESRELKRVGRPIMQKRIDLTPGDVWQTAALDLEKLIQPDPGSLYRVELHIRHSYSTYPCTTDEKFEVDASTYVTDNYDRPSTDYHYYWNQPFYSWRDRDNPCNPTYYYEGNGSAAKNLIASNIGLTLKSNDLGEHYILATDLITASPLSGVQVDFMDLQNNRIGGIKTQSDGMAKLKLEREAFLAVASRGKEKTYLRIDQGSALSLSSFQVEGTKVSEGIKGFIYGERGVWRPGDSLFLNFILDDISNPLPKAHPIVFTLENPNGQIIDRQSATTPGKIFPFTTRTPDNAQTGLYLAKVSIGGSEFTRGIRIETIKPNRLRIQLKPQSGEYLSTNNPNILLSSEWLTGALAGGYPLKVEMTIRKGNGRFTDYPGFNFMDQVGSFYSTEPQPIEGKLDANGNYVIQAEVRQTRNIPGMLAVDVFSRVYEPGGDFSINRQTMNLAPFKSFVGIKTPESKDSPWLTTGRNHNFSVVSVDPQGKKLSRKLSYEVYHIDWSWWYNHSRGEGIYLNERFFTKVQEGTLRTERGAGNFNLQIDEPNWGNYLVRVCDDQSGHCAAEKVYIDWPLHAQRSRKTGSGPSILQFWAEKDQFSVGEKAVINIPSAKETKMYISVENGSEVLQQFWIDGKENFTPFTLDITEKMAPNVYVYVAQFQPHGQTANDLPIRSFGYLPLSVDNPENRLLPKIEMKEELKPEEKFSVKVSEQNGRAMTYTIAIVDEGLLDLTNFRTPNPHAHFYSKEALGIRTWDMYDFVVQAFGGKIEQLMAIGGGDELTGAKPKTNLRFRPVVLHAGPFSLQKGKSITHEFTMPNYVGSVRAMVIAAEGPAYGSAETTAAVKLPLMVQTTLPRVLGPGERIQIPVQLFAMDKSVKDVKVKAKVTGDARLILSEAQAKFTEPGEQMVMLELEVGDRTGNIIIDIQATSGANVANDKTNIGVRYPVGRQSLSKWKKVDPGSNATIDLEALGITNSNNAVLEFSGMPDINLNKRLQSLITYPHGCLEQSISRVFPQIYLQRFTELSQEDKEKVAHQVSAMLLKVVQLQNANGGMNFWPGSRSTHNWGSSYTLHFLIEARNQGFNIPEALFSNLMRYQANEARNNKLNEDNRYDSDFRFFNQAYRLYTLALAGKPEIGAMNRLKAKIGNSNTTANLLAAAYMLSGQTKAAEELYNNNPVGSRNYRNAFTMGSNIRDQAMMLESAVLVKKDRDAAMLAENLIKALSSDSWMSTQEIAWSLCALGRYFAKHDPGKAYEAQFSMNGGRKESISGKGQTIRREFDEASGYSAEISNTGKSPLYVRLTTTGIPAIGNEIEYANNLNLSVTYLNNNRQTIDVSNLQQGTDFIARVTVQRTSSIMDMSDLALTQIFPSGWEIISSRIMTGDDESDHRDFRDDRVYTYFDLNQNASVTFEVRLSATYKGSFYLPPVQVEGMYSNEVGALKKGKLVKVE